MFWLGFPFLRFVLFLLTGILLGRYAGPVYPEVQAAWLMLWLFLLILPRRGVIRITCAWMLLVATGWISYRQTMKLPDIEGTRIALRITSPGRKGDRRQRYEARVEAAYQTTWRPVRAKVLLYIQDTLTLTPGQRLVVEKTPDHPRSPPNPYIFDYAGYLKDQHMAGLLFAGSHDLLLLDHKENLKDKIAGLRSGIIKRIRRIYPDPAHSEILAGILLGEKTGLDPGLKRVYSLTGSMHVLAVSGLHVGIVLMIIRGLLFFLPNYPFWRLLKNLLCMTGLIFYAALTEFSPSVTRAVTFFLLHAIALLLGREGKLTHSLTLTAFIMLAYDPVQAFQPGFQLSFSAVAGILIFTNWMRTFCFSARRLVDRVLELLCMSIGAQAGTLAFTLYYFHLLSFSALPASLVVIPAAFLLIGTASLSLLVPWEMISEWLALGVGFILDLMEGILRWLSALPGSYISDLYPELTMLIAVMLIMLLMVTAFCGKRITPVWIALGLLLWIGLTRKDRGSDIRHWKKLFISRVEGYPCVGIAEGTRVMVFYDTNISNIARVKQAMLPVFMANGIASPVDVPFQAVNMRVEIASFGKVEWVPGRMEPREALQLPVIEGGVGGMTLPGPSVRIHSKQLTQVRVVQMDNNGFYEMNYNE